MKAMAFDGIARELGEVSTRRSFFRLLGGAAAVGAGLAVTARDESLGKSRGRSKGKPRGKERDRAGASVTAQGRSGKKKITICFQGQTRTVKKSKLGNFPGATRGACPTGGTGGTGGGQTQPVICTRWTISGGPNATDNIVVDDDLGIYNLSRGGAGIISEFDGRASTIGPVDFDANVGEKLRIYAYDRGACRSLSPLWLHCKASGKSRMLYKGYAGVNCNYAIGGFVEEFVEVWI